MTSIRQLATYAGTILAGHALGLGVPPASGAQTFWNAPGGSFHDAGNWTNGVPAPGDDAIFAAPTTHATVSFDADVNNQTLTVARGVYVLDLNHATYTLSDVFMPVRFTGTELYRVTLLDGTIGARKATIDANDDLSRLTIGTDGTLDLAGKLTLEARLTVDAGGRLYAIGAQIGSGVPTDEGFLTVEDGGIATFTGANEVVLTTGEIRLDTSGQMTTEGDVRLEQVSPSLDVVGGATLDVGGALIIGDGEQAEMCILTGGQVRSFDGVVEGGGYVYMEDAGSTWTIDNDLVFSGTSEMEIYDGALVNVAGTTDNGFGIVLNGGTLRTGTLETNGASIGFGAAGGRIEVGSLTFFGKLEVTENAVVDVVTEGMFIQFDSDLDIRAAGQVSAPSLLVGAVPGTVRVAGGTLDLAAQLYVAGQGAVSASNDAVITAETLFVFNGVVGLDDAVLLVGADAAAPDFGSALVVDGPGPASAEVALENANLSVLGGGVLIAPSAGGQGELTIDNGARVAAGYVEIGASDGSSAHAVVMVAGGAELYSDAAMIVHAGGELRLDDGLLATELYVHVSGELSGNGTVRASLINEGTLRPGAPIGLLHVAWLMNPAMPEYAQTSAGVLEIELAGFTPSQFDRLEVEGDASLGGTLRLTPIEGFEPQPGQGFEIITILGAGAVTGTFDTVEPAGWDVLYLNDRVIVTFTDPCPADFDGTGVVGFSDLQMLLQAWGDCPAECPWNLDGIGSVGFGDLQLLLQAWGVCP